jgi:hypothetical protein
MINFLMSYPGARQLHMTGYSGRQILIAFFIFYDVIFEDVFRNPAYINQRASKSSASAIGTARIFSKELNT